ncbi:hypothetical protein [Streptomyces xantholiticus]|uniref:Tail assembly chaperone n=1 Tax=Streptomyces xantholiticus TaxID=68285 RepID=A0ABV1UZN7_9ACTN
MTVYEIDLDAERREVQYPDGINVRLRDHGFRFPAELPADALTPLLSEELDLMGLLGDLVRSQSGGSTWEVIDLVLRRRDLPRQFDQAVKDTYKTLLGEEAFERFLSISPSIGDYVRLTKALAKLYGVELGKLFGLGDSSKNAGEMSSPTSADSTTDSTPAEPGAAPAIPDSSASAG